MGVLDRLPEQVPISLLRDVRRAQIESKATQLTGGSSSRTYWSENEAQFDWVGRIDTPSPQVQGYGGALVRVKLEASVEWPIVDYVVELYKSTNGTSWQRLYGDESPTTSPYYTYTVYETPASTAEPSAVYLHVWLAANINSWAAVKVIGMSNDELTVTVTRVG